MLRSKEDLILFNFNMLNIYPLSSIVKVGKAIAVHAMLPKTAEW